MHIYTMRTALSLQQVYCHTRAMLYAQQCPHNYLTCVRVEANSGMEPLSCLQHIEGESHLRAVSLSVDLVQGILQVQPEAGLLEGSTTGSIPLQTGHLHARVCESVCGSENKYSHGCRCELG